MTKLRRTYIREWRQHRGMSQSELSARVGTSMPTISRLESGKQQYTQGTLEALALALQCEPADLISREPGDASDFWSVWNNATQEERVRIEAVARALVQNSSHG